MTVNRVLPLEQGASAPEEERKSDSQRREQCRHAESRIAGVVVSYADPTAGAHDRLENTDERHDV